jgi:hypothetical protein
MMGAAQDGNAQKTKKTKIPREQVCGTRGELRHSFAAKTYIGRGKKTQKIT